MIDALMMRKEQNEEIKKRLASVKKMIKNYDKTKKTNYRLLLNHIIIIQNCYGVQESIIKMKDELNNAAEISYLNSFFYFLKYIEYKSEEMCFELYEKITKEIN